MHVYVEAQFEVYIQKSSWFDLAHQRMLQPQVFLFSHGLAAVDYEKYRE